MAFNKIWQEAHKTNSQLTEINFSPSPTDNNIQKRLSTLLNVNTNVTKFRLFSICGYKLDDVVVVMVAFLMRNTILAKLELSTGLNNAQLKLLAHSLKINTGLTSLAIGHNRISDLRDLVEGLNINTSITFLDLSWNLINFNNIETMLSKVLQINTTLKVLDLTGNNLNETAVKYLAHGLKTNTSLMTLNLSSNAIGDKGTKYLTLSLNVNTSLTALNLQSTRITNEGAMVLAHCLRTNSSLKTLLLSHNCMDMSGVKFCCLNILLTNESLVYLNVKNNHMSHGQAESLTKLLENKAKRDPSLKRELQVILTSRVSFFQSSKPDSRQDEEKLMTFTGMT